MKDFVKLIAILSIGAAVVILYGLFEDDSNRENKDINDEVSTSNPVSNEYLIKYVGVYRVDYTNLPEENPSEAFSLRNDGTAAWAFITYNVYGKGKAAQKKPGTWTATENEISITIKGNTGLITEEFVLRDGTFYSGDRYLVPKYVMPN